MSDVFVSYAAEDRERAREVARALEQFGWSVWWDRKIVAGDTFDQTIERELESAKSVVVLWSNASVVSEWVKNEATAAAERQVLVPALIEDVRIPLEFRRRQTANLVGWEGDASHEGFQALRGGVAARVGTPAVVGAPRPTASSPARALPWRRWAIAGVAVALLIAAVGAYRILVGSREAQETASGVDGSNRGVTAGTGPIEDRTSPKELNVAGTKVVTASASGPNSIDSPAPLAFGTLHKVTLENDEAYYFRLPVPASAIKIVQDVRLPKNERSNLQTQLSILDEDGAVIQQNVVAFNEVDNGYRKTAEFSVKQPARFGFKLLNTSSHTADIWLAVSPPDKAQFLPLFGSIVPQAWSPAKDATGTLDEIEDAYYVVRLPRGDYRVILDFTNAKRERTNLQGYLAVLDADGGRQQQVININQVDVSYRKVGTLSVKSDEPIILRVQNGSHPVEFNLRIVKAQ